MMGGGGGFGGMPPAQPADARPLRERYATELAQVKEMGFTDEDTILSFLQQSQGNVQIAIERLFSGLGN